VVAQRQSCRSNRPHSEGSKETPMKKAYTASTFVAIGHAVAETLGGTGSNSESNLTKTVSAGGVGFYL